MGGGSLVHSIVKDYLRTPCCDASSTPVATMCEVPLKANSQFKVEVKR
jgi:hypothetical protein